MLKQVKDALRVKNAAFDDEVKDLIASCLADLRLAGACVATPEIYLVDWDEDTPELADPLIVRAIKLYAKANFGYIDTAQAARFQQAYDHLKCAMLFSGDYKEAEAGDGVE